MIRRVVPFADLHVAVGAPDNVGDGINLGSSVGASLSDAERDSAYWVPVSEWTRRDGTTATFPHLVRDRAKPGIIAVCGDGRRFVNAADSYHVFVREIGRAHVCTPVTNAHLVCRLLLEKQLMYPSIHNTITCPSCSTPLA